MNLKTIKQYSATITAKQADIERLNAEAERCRVAIDTAGRHTETIESLRRVRAELNAKGFLTRSVVDTADIDAKIETAERLNALALHDGESAVTALEMVEGQISDAHDELAALADKRQMAVHEFCKAELEAAEVAYSKAVDAMRDSLARIVASCDLMDRAAPAGAPRSGSSISSNYTETNKMEHLSAPRSQNYSTPAWLYGNGLGAPERAELLKVLKGAGVELDNGQLALVKAA